MTPFRHLWPALLFTLTACASSSLPARFYTLAPSDTAATRAVASPLIVEVLPVRVPQRLARPQIVVRDAAGDAGQVRILEQDRWSSHFNDELHDALVGSITNRLGAIDAGCGIGLADQRRYRIAVELTQFDAVPDARLQTGFSWSVQRSDTGEAIACRSVQSQPLQGGIAGVVLGVRQAVSAVSEQVSAAVDALEAGRTADCAS